MAAPRALNVVARIELWGQAVYHGSGGYQVGGGDGMRNGIQVSFARVRWGGRPGLMGTGMGWAKVGDA